MNSSPVRVCVCVCSSTLIVPVHVVIPLRSETVYHVHRVSQRCRRRAPGRHPQVRLLGQRLQREHGGELQLRGRKRRAGQEAQDGVPENGTQGCGAAGGQARAEERGQRAGESQDARPVQSLLPAEDHAALGTGGHQALQTGHAAPGVQLHRAPPADTGERQI